MSAVSIMSLIAIGTPCSGPRRGCLSSSRAARIAASASI
jgi:hypothetical protein